MPKVSSESLILVVDDDPDVLVLLNQILKPGGYRVVGAVNGEEAYDFAVRDPPDLVLMDIGMPDIDGLQTVWRMREDPLLAEVPVVIITAYDSYDLRSEAASAGCKGYVTKPFDPRQLQELVREILEE